MPPISRNCNWRATSAAASAAAYRATSSPFVLERVVRRVLRPSSGSSKDYCLPFLSISASIAYSGPEAPACPLGVLVYARSCLLRCLICFEVIAPNQPVSAIAASTSAGAGLRPSRACCCSSRSHP